MTVEPNPAAGTIPPNDDTLENVWTYRGYRMKSGEFNTAMVHFYRGEISRSNTWRMRLDNTTNWAVVTMAAVLTFTFSSTSNSHVVILISMLLMGLFLVIEARRYRYYELWTLRVRLMETDFFAALLAPPFAPHQEWATRLVDSLLNPEFPISMQEALGRRLRRNYIWIFLILGVAWILKLMLHPSPAYSIRSFLEHARIGYLAGERTVIIIAVFFAVVILIALLTSGLRASAGEVLPREALKLSGELLQSLANAASSVFPDELPFLHRRDHLAIIITAKTEEVSQQLLSFLKRGVTALHGVGMYSREPRSVLLCAIAPAEIARLRSLVYSIDENAFVVVNPTAEVWGGGFGSLQPRWRQASQKSGKKEG